MCGVICLCFGLCHALIVVASRVHQQVYARIGAHFLGQHSRVKHHVQQLYVVFLLEVTLLAGLHEPLARAFGQKLVLAVVMMDAVGEPHTLQIQHKFVPFLRGLVAGVVLVHALADAANTQIVAAILVRQDVPTPQCGFAQVVHKSLLLNTQVLKSGHAIAQYTQVIKLIYHIRKILNGGRRLLALLITCQQRHRRQQHT